MRAASLPLPLLSKALQAMSFALGATPIPFVCPAIVPAQWVP